MLIYHLGFVGGGFQSAATTEAMEGRWQAESMAMSSVNMDGTSEDGEYGQNSISQTIYIYIYISVYVCVC